jgi:integrase
MKTPKEKPKKRRRGRGEGSIYERKDGRFAGVVNVGYRNGKRVRKNVYGETRGEVQEQLKKLLREQQLGLPVAVERQTVKHFLTNWLENTAKPRLRPKSFVSYKQLTEHHLVPTIGKIELAKLTPQDVQELLNEMVKKGLSARTAQYVRAVLRRALNQALKWGLVARNVAALVDPPRILRHEVQPFAVEEIKKLLGLFEQNRLGALYLLALTHGLRQGEALGLRWEDVDLKKKELRVRQTLQWVDGEWQFVEPKTKQSRRGFALTEQIVKALRKHRKAQLEERLLAGGEWNEYGLVFTTRTGKPLDGVNVTRDFKRLLKRGKLPVRRFHDLRHTTASLLLYQKVHPRVVMDLLGHSEIRVTMDLYSHVAPVLQREAADEMDALLRTVKARRK